MGSSFTNVCIVGKDLLKTLRKLFYLRFCVFSWPLKKTQRSKVFASYLRNPLYENNCNYNSCKFGYKFAFVIFLFFPRNQKQDSNFLQVCCLVTKKFFAFLFIASRALFQRHAEINRPLYWIFLACYSCLYYSFML